MFMKDFKNIKNLLTGKAVFTFLPNKHPSGHPSQGEKKRPSFIPHHHRHITKTTTGPSLLRPFGGGRTFCHALSYFLYYFLRKRQDEKTRRQLAHHNKNVAIIAMLFQMYFYPRECNTWLVATNLGAPVPLFALVFHNLTIDFFNPPPHPTFCTKLKSCLLCRCLLLCC